MARKIRTLVALALSLAAASPLLAQKDLAAGVPAPAKARVPGPPALGAAGSRAAAMGPKTRIADLARPAAPHGGLFTIQIDPGRLAEAGATAGGLLIEGFPLGIGRAVDLEVERFWVTRPGTRFVAAGADGRDAPLAFDPESVVLLRGRVAGHPHSGVYIAVSELVSNGIIDLGKGSARYGVSSRDRSGGALPPGMLGVFEAASGGPNPMPFCHVLDPGGVVPPSPDMEPVKGLRQIELAVDTDHEFFQLFGSEAATAAYIVELYGAVSDIMMRNINTRVDLTYARVWPQANEPFEAGLFEFGSYWQSNMGSVPRDAAQMFSGRGDRPGGQAYLNSLCNSNAYGFCGNAVGSFADPTSSSVFNYDPLVAAHELGHNFGTHHTDVYGIDNCNIVAATPQRGTIMSYCNQTVSGAMSVIDMEFHKVTRDKMLEYIVTRPACAVFDCNQNGVSDAVDIVMSTSADANSNGIPDECEDCNHNSVLDPVDIAAATSLDLNINGIPDECEPDCNNNLIPDDRDILLGTSQDLHGDNIPDECDADRNTNTVSDYNEIMADMTLDKDRDRILDATQDCDGDTAPDLVELEGARNGWVASLLAEGAIREYHSVTGVLMDVSDAGRVTAAQDLIITADRRILVSSGANKIVEYDRTGAFVRDLVPAGSGGLAGPSGMLVSPWGTLLVASRASNAVLEYDAASGVFIRAFVAAGSGGLASPFGLAFKPGGNLFVSSQGQNRVYEYDRASGAFVRIFVAAGAGTLSSPRGLLFNPLTGNLLVTGFNNNQVKEYHGGTGAFIRNWLVTGLPIGGPWCIRVGPDGYIYISGRPSTDTHVTRAHIFIHDPRNGNFVRAYVQAQDSGLSNPTGFDFMPGDFTDCNRNQLPDSCDIASGFSSDVNTNGIPDECERTCYANCDLSTVSPVLNVNDFTCFLNLYAAGNAYANCDGSTVPPVLNVSDFTCYLNAYALGCP